MRVDLNYSPSDSFETMPFPLILAYDLEAVGKNFHDVRSKALISLSIGLTKLYNLVNFSDCVDRSIEHLRVLQIEMDQTVVRSYGWQDVLLDHGFHSVPYLPENDRIRFTICEQARLEILRRLARLNRERWLAEQIEETSAKAIPKAPAKRPRATLSVIQGGLL